jgi:hypothetical protein
MIIHIFWRLAYGTRSRDPEGMMELPFIRVPLSVLVGFLNAIHPWRVGNGLLLIFFLIILISSWFLNLYPYSPFYARAQPFTIQGFAVQRTQPPVREEIAPGDALTMVAGESVIVEVMLLGEANVSCTWSILSKPDAVETGCSIDYSALTPGVNDILSVYAQPACGIGGKSESLFIAEQP